MGAVTALPRWPATARSPAAPGEREYLLLQRKLYAIDAARVLRAPRDAHRSALSALLAVRMLEGEDLKPALKQLQRMGRFSIIKIDQLHTMAKALLYIASEMKNAEDQDERAAWEDRLRRAWTLLVPLHNDVRNASHFVGATNEAPSEEPVTRRSAEHKIGTLQTQRVHRRVDIELDVNFASRSNFYTGVTENLSEGGVFIATSRTKPVGSALNVKLALPDHGEPIQITGIVRWVRKKSAIHVAGLGIHFEGVAEEDAERIRAFIAQRNPIVYGG